MRREEKLAEVEQMMLDALKVTHDWWKATCGAGPGFEGDFVAPSQQLVKLYKDTHSAILASIRANISSESPADELSPLEQLAKLEELKEELVKKVQDQDNSGTGWPN
jgi:hypothetical protein